MVRAMSGQLCRGLRRGGLRLDRIAFQGDYAGCVRGLVVWDILYYPPLLYTS